jgi:outer membrane protein OmpA-like peptidoglycan-associated protein
MAEKFINKGNYFGFYATPAADVMVMAMATEENAANEDLFVSFFKDGQWTDPVSLGSEINTATEELAPFLSKDGKTLFFASKGFGGQGSVDIFVTKRLDDTWTRWEKPVNLGAEVNRSGFDAYFSMDEKEEIAYFVSGESDGDLGDIYSVAIKDIPVLNPKPVEPVVVRQEEPAPTPAPEPKPEPKPEVVLENFKNILFDFNKHGIRPSEGKKLDKLANFLSKNPTVQVVLKGHTDAVGGEDFNNELSQKRCESSQEYLIEKGIEASRISIEKFGEKKPVSSNKSSQGRQLNRRVEITVSAE